MPVPATQLVFDERIVAAKKHNLYCLAHAPTVAIRPLERRTGEHGIFSSGKRLLDLLAQAFQPRLSVFVGQRMTAAHFFDICRLMKVVGLNETPAELSRQQLTDRRFTS